MRNSFTGRAAGVALAAAALLAVAVASPAQSATPAIQITKVYYNSPGMDDGSNSSLNAEWVRLTNTHTYTINLRNWTLRDKSNHVYSFGNSNVYLGAGKRLYIHTGKGTNGYPDAQHRYWGLSWYVWNNTGDTAYLRTGPGTLIDTCTWGSAGSYTYC